MVNTAGKSKAPRIYVTETISNLCPHSVDPFAWSHHGPDPLGHWNAQSTQVKNGKLLARLGLDGTLSFEPSFIKDRSGESIFFEGPKAKCLLAADFKTIHKSMPRKALTVSAWVSISAPRGSRAAGVTI